MVGIMQNCRLSTLYSHLFNKFIGVSHESAIEFDQY